MNLILTSYFAKAAHLLPTIYGKPLTECTIAFIPTAANIEEVDFYVAEARQALTTMGATVQDLDIATADMATISATITGADCIYISGGHTFYLLQQLQNSGAAELITKAVRHGTWYIGESAGSAVAADDCAYIQPLEDPQTFDVSTLTDFSGLNLTSIRVLPHYDNPMFMTAVHQAITTHPEVVAITDDQAVHITDANNANNMVILPGQ